MLNSIPVSSIRNARELGGYTNTDGKKVKKNVLLRTASLNGISDGDIRTLTEKFRVEHIIDFRMPMEMQTDAYPTISGAEYHNLNVVDKAMFSESDSTDVDFNTVDIVEMVSLAEKAGMLNEDMYILFLSMDAGKTAYTKFFRILLDADPERAVLWHCTGGKDRTGLAAMLLLSALGADEELIVSDYMLTNEYNAQRIEKTRQHLKAQGLDDALIDKAVLVFDAVDERFMRNVIAYLKKEYGSVKGYILSELNLSQADIEALKEKYLL